MNPPKIVLFVGAAGTGKTWAMGRCLRLTSQRPQVIVSRWADPSLLYHIKPNANTVPRWNGGHIIIPQNGRHLLIVAPLPTKELLLFQRDLARALMGLPRSVLAIDEAHMILRRGYVHSEMVRIIRGARHYGLTVYMATQRIVDVDPDIRAVVTDIFAFRTASGLDLHWLESEGIPSAAASTLPVGTYIYLSKLTGRITKGKS